MPIPIVWTVAGADCSGGAGIQADLKTFADFGVHGCSVLTAMTAQNSQQVQAIEYVSAKLLTAQINCLMAELTPSAIKLGLLGNAATITIISEFMQQAACPMVYDPVLFASNGAMLMDLVLLAEVQQKIFPHERLLAN